jgi:hypothetical protein
MHNWRYDSLSYSHPWLDLERRISMVDEHHPNLTPEFIVYCAKRRDDAMLKSDS